MSSLGDIFHALPTVHSLKVRLGATIDWVTQREYVELVKCFTDVECVIPFSRRGFFGNLGEFLKTLRAREYDYVIDLQGLLKSAVVARMARGSVRIGPSFHREGSRVFYSAVAGPRDSNRHAVDRNMDVVRYMGLSPVDPQFPVEFPPQNVFCKRPRVAMLPISRWTSKNWPVYCFAEVGRGILAGGDASIFLLGSKNEVEVCRGICSEIGEKVFNLAGVHSLTETGGILKEMDLLISNDSGPMHMAAALGTPVLAVFGPTNPARTGPYGDRHRVVTAPLPCRPCYLRSCPKPGVPCMEEVTPERIIEEALAMLADNAESLEKS